MLAARPYSLVSSLVLLLLACDPGQPLEPAIQAASRSAGPAVKAPSNANGVAVSESRIALGWQDNSTNETGFEVHRSTTGASGPFLPRVTTGGNVTGVDDAGLEPLTQYCYHVRALRTLSGKTQYSGFSNTTCATTLPPPLPSAASAVDARPLWSTMVEVWWTNNATNEDGFRVERSTDGGASWTVAGTTSRDWHAFHDYGRTSEQQVCYRVIAFNGHGDSPPSNTACTTPPAGPTNLTVIWIDEQTIDITWTDNSAVEDGYEVRFFDPEGYCEAVLILPANSTSLRSLSALCSITVAAMKDDGFSDVVGWP